MNRLIEFLRLENNLSVERLREVYRALCMRTHPDSGKGTDEGFKRLQAEYEGALAELAGCRTGTAPTRRRASSADPRRAVLERLYLYTVRFYGSESPGLMAELIRAARDYDPGFAALLESYDEAFLSCFHSWESNGTVYYTHCLLISSIKQLFYHFSFGLPHHARLFRSLLEDLERRAGKLGPAQREVIHGLARWLREEEGKGRVPLHFV